jgi:hypothetical protein
MHIFNILLQTNKNTYKDCHVAYPVYHIDEYDLYKRAILVDVFSCIDGTGNKALDELYDKYPDVIHVATHTITDYGMQSMLEKQEEFNDKHNLS